MKIVVLAVVLGAVLGQDDPGTTTTIPLTTMLDDNNDSVFVDTLETTTSDGSDVATVTMTITTTTPAPTTTTVNIRPRILEDNDESELTTVEDKTSTTKNSDVTTGTTTTTTITTTTTAAPVTTPADIKPRILDEYDDSVSVDDRTSTTKKIEAVTITTMTTTTTATTTTTSTTLAPTTTTVNIRPRILDNNNESETTTIENKTSTTENSDVTTGTTTTTTTTATTTAAPTPTSVDIKQVIPDEDNELAIDAAKIVKTTTTTTTTMRTTTTDRRPKILAEPDRILFFVPNQPLVLECAVESDPSDPTRYSWTRNGRPFTIDNINVFSESQSNGNILFTNPSISDAGTYQCEAINKYGKAFTRASLMMARSPRRMEFRKARPASAARHLKAPSIIQADLADLPSVVRSKRPAFLVFPQPQAREVEPFRVTDSSNGSGL